MFERVLQLGLIYQFLTCYQSLYHYLCIWPDGENFFHKFREKIKHQKTVIAGLVDRVDEDGVKEYIHEKDKLNELLLHEEVYWEATG